MAVARAPRSARPERSALPTTDRTQLEGIRLKVFLDRYSLKDPAGTPIEQHPEEMWWRVAQGIASVEKTADKRRHWAERFYQAMAGFKFVPGGRILAGAGTGHEVTYYNCYVTPSPEDSRSGILDNLKIMTEIMARGGGVGINLSTLRPRGSYIRTVNGTASGPCSWAELYSVATGDVIQQGGCFGPDERIATDQGLLRATELADRVEAGQAINALTHRGPRRITWAFRNGRKPLFRVTTARGFTVDVTQEHKMGVLRDGHLVTVPLAELEVGDEILLLLADGVGGEKVALDSPTYQRSIMSTRLNEEVRLPDVLDERLAYFLGYLHGDGYVHWGRKVTWHAPKAVKLATADAYPAIRQRLVDLARDLFGLEPVIEKRQEGCATVALYSRILVAWLEGNGLLKARSDVVHVPEAIFRSPSAVVGAFVAGYFDADGSDRGRKGGYGFDSVSLKMLRDVQQLLAANGILSHITTTDRSAEGWRTIHRLVVTGAEFKSRMNAFVALSLKNRGIEGHRNHHNHYPRETWVQLGVPGRYYQGVWDSTKPRISYRALSRVQERLEASGQVALAERLEQVLHTIPDHIVGIEAVGLGEVYDFEVDDVHMLSGGGLYTSNSRRGALMLMLDDDHPDIEEFITVKQDLSRINHANLSVCVSDAFMDAVKNDQDWHLKWNGEVRKTLKARYLWDLICTAAWRSAEPGVVFMDRYNKESNTWYYENIRCVNPCVTGETLIYTSRGLRRAAELAAEGARVDVAVDGRFGAGRFRPASTVFPTGVRAVFRLLTAEGYEVRLTGDHRVMTERGWMEAARLVPGDKLRILNQKGGFGSEGSRDLGLVLGWLVGDGTFRAAEAVLSFFGLEKSELAPQFAAAVGALVAGTERSARAYRIGVGTVAGRDEARVSSVRLARLLEEHGLRRGERLKVPESVFTGCEEMQRAFLQALFTADGHVSGDLAKGASVRLTSVERSLLVDVQRLLLNFGIASAIYSDRRSEQVRELPDGRGGRAPYRCRAYHELVISRDNLARFGTEIGFLTDAKNAALAARTGAYRRGPYRESFTATVVGLVPDGEEQVFDLTEPATHSFIANGLVCHNCGEQGLGPWGVCNLGALNLAAFVEGGAMDYQGLAEYARVATRFLDNVVDANLYFIKENAEAQLGTRRTGLGTMGLGDALIKLGLRYGAEESLPVVERIYETIRDAAYDASADSAAEKGPFPFFEREKYLQGRFIQRLPEPIRAKIDRNGIRNAVLLTQAPTGTTSLLSGVSSGIEPVFDFAMRRRDRTGEHILYHPLFKAWRDGFIAERGREPRDDERPAYFVGANDLTPEDHVHVQAVVQKHTDSSISKTVNAPNSHTVEEVKRLYTLAYELGCKGVTYFRDGCREGVLEHIEEKPKAPVEANGHADTTAALALPKMTPDRTKRPEMLSGYTRQVVAPEGKISLTLNSDDAGLYEVFISVGRSGSDLMAMAEALGRMISYALQIPSTLTPEERAREIARQLRGIGGSRSVGFGAAQVRSLPDAVAMALLKHLEGEGGALMTREGEQQLQLPINPVRANLCPGCGSASLVYEEGCKKCYACGHSEC